MSEFWGWNSKADFVDWCRDKALQLLTCGDRLEAFDNFVYNIEKHHDYSRRIFDDTRHQIIEGRKMIANSQLFNLEEVKGFLLSIR